MPDPEPARRTQAERRAQTRAALMNAARALFVEKGFAETGTPEIAALAGVTRGALYHQFADKADLFRAVVGRETEAVGYQIDETTRTPADPSGQLEAGTRAYFAAMAVPGRALLLLLQAPAVLETDVAVASVGGHDVVQLRAGLAEARPGIDPVDLDALTDVVSAAFDRAALAISQGGSTEHYVRAMLRLVKNAAA